MESGAATILRFGAKRSSEAPHEGRVHSRNRLESFASHAEKNLAVRFSTAFARVIHRISTTFPYNTNSPCMMLRIAFLVALVWLAAAPPANAADATLLRLFLRDGTSVVSYGEFARLDDEV